MIVKLIAILFILIGIAGLVLPIVPGILMIIMGILLLYRDRHEEITRLVNEKAPAALADFYHNFLHRMIVPSHYIGVDWPWVKQQILRTERMDPKSKDARSENIGLALDECMRIARAGSIPKYISIEKKITAFGGDFIEIEGNIKFYTKKITSFISGASHLVLFLVTIGDNIESQASLLTSGKDPLKGYLLDRIGSFAVESMADNLEKRLRKDYGLKKKSLSSRFSPGYCDWPIEDQFKMAAVLDFSKAGVTLTDGCMMVPKKSISAIAAVGDEGVFKDLITSCDICEIKDCDYKRVSFFNKSSQNLST